MSTSTPGSVNAINVDTQGETVEYQFIDDKGNQTTDVPAGVSVSFSDPNGVVSFTVDASNPYKASVVPTGTPGTAEITPSVSGFNDASGNPVPNPEPVSVEVDPGAAVGGRLVVTNDPGTPAPVVTPTDPNQTPPVTDPADPGTGGTTPPSDPAAITSTDQLEKSVYVYSGDSTTADASLWTASGFVTGDGSNTPLFFFSGDTAAGTASGNGQTDQGGTWSFYTGPVQAAS